MKVRELSEEEFQKIIDLMDEDEEAAIGNTIDLTSVGYEDLIDALTGGYCAYYPDAEMFWVFTKEDLNKVGIKC